MILGLYKPLAPEQEVELSLSFSDGETMKVISAVQKIVKGKGMSEHKGHEHHHHGSN